MVEARCLVMLGSEGESLRSEDMFWARGALRLCDKLPSVGGDSIELEGLTSDKASGTVAGALTVVAWFIEERIVGV